MNWWFIKVLTVYWIIYWGNIYIFIQAILYDGRKEEVFEQKMKKILNSKKLNKILIGLLVVLGACFLYYATLFQGN